MGALAKLLGRGLKAPKVPPGVIPPPVRELRAKMLGFDTEAYRGGTRPHDPASGADVKFFTDNPEIADTYLRRQYYDDYTGKPSPPLPNGEVPYADGATVAKVKLRLGRSADVNGLKPDGSTYSWSRLPVANIEDDVVREKATAIYGAHGILTTDEIARVASDLGYDSVRFKNIRDAKSFQDEAPPSTIYAILKPHNIRSKWAKFDPRDALKADLMAGIGGGAVVAGALGQQQRSEYQ
jgi:hypothetical protein